MDQTTTQHFPAALRLGLTLAVLGICYLLYEKYASVVIKMPHITPTKIGRPRVRVHFLLFITLILASSMSFGVADQVRKTDVITLYNGDRVTGEIKHLFAGLLEVNTDSMGTLNIEWQEVSKIESLYHYEVRVTEGKRYYGKLEKSARAGEISLSDVYGEHEISSLEVVEIRPVAQSFKDRIDIYLALGYSYTKASSLGQTTLNTDITYDTEKSSNTLSGRLIVTDTDSEVTTSSKTDLSRRIWTDRESTYRTISGTYETNDELALDYRFSAGFGLGRHFTDTQRSTWLGEAGVQVLTEKSLVGDTQESVEAFLSTKFSTWKYTTPELKFKFDFSLYPSLTENGRIRGDTDISLRWEIIEDLFWDVTAFGAYDNEAAEDSQFDYGLSTGLGWNF